MAGAGESQFRSGQVHGLTQYGGAEPRRKKGRDLPREPSPRLPGQVRRGGRGGPDTRDTIGGMVRTSLAAEYRVVVYARADAWYIQPTPFAMQPIEADNTWRTWTHTGSSYAALVVRKSFKPMTRLDVLPQVDAEVLSRAIVEGRK